MAVWAYRSGMDFAVLGPLRVTGSDGPIDVPGVKERTLLANLIADAGRLVPCATLVEGYRRPDPRSAVKSLQTYVSRLRNVLLEPDRTAEPVLLVTDGPGYRLAVPKTAVDAERFVVLADSGRRSLADQRPDLAVRTLRTALELWRGPAYAGFESTSFGQAEARRLTEIRLAVWEGACRRGVGGRRGDGGGAGSGAAARGAPVPGAVLGAVDHCAVPLRTPG